MLWAALVTILLAWLAAVAACVGFGLAIGWLGQSASLSTERLFLSFWLGWGALIAFVQVWQLFLPVNGWAVLLALLMGLLGLAWHRRALFGWWRNRPSASSLYLGGLVLIAVWLASLGLDPIHNYDTGLYHLSAVRWNTTYAIVPGLANLHSRLGYNSSFFLYAAFFEVGNWQGKAYHFANGLLCLVFTAYGWWAVVRTIVVRERIPLHLLLTICLAIPLAYYQVSYSSNLSNDLAIFLLGALVAIYLCRLVFDEFDGVDQLDATRTLGSILFLCAIGTTIKLSFLPLGVATCLVGLLAYWWEKSLPGRIYPVRTLALFVFLSFFVLVFWGLRGVVLSGYIAFPSPLLSFDLPWRVPREFAVEETNWIVSWARWPGQPPGDVSGNWNWLPVWIRSHAMDYRILFPMLAFVLGLVLLLRRTPSGTRSTLDDAQRWRWVAFFFPAVFALITWFLSAPEVRFAGVAFWWLGAGALALGAYRQGVTRPVLLAACLAGLVWYTPYIARRTLFPRPDFVRSFASAPLAPTVIFRTDSGLDVNVPAQGDQCWDAPLPCTPAPVADLRLLIKDDLSAGFTVLPLIMAPKSSGPGPP